MGKARLVKKQEAVEREQAKNTKLPQRKAMEKTMDAMVGWLKNQRVQRQDPRKAFADLFAQPQPQSN